MNFTPTGIEGLWLLQASAPADARGKFVKTFQTQLFAEAGIEFEIKEQFFSVSHANVLRGMHFQLPPYDHAKLVFCISGSAEDVVVDLRKESATCGKAFSVTLSANAANGIFVPRGFAHGFLSLEENTCLLYNTDCAYAPTHDAGVLWSSIDHQWTVKDPIISPRDCGLPRLDAFQNPF